jgi:UDP-N-acetylmuramyl pentapeptide phosphotransferase/UDP-N-acetylglucosamine-1-phosphate transferase
MELTHHILPMWGIAAAAGGLVWLLAPLVVAFCRRQGLVAGITHRSSHSTPTPHGGGIIFPLVVVPVGLFLTWWWPLPFKGYLSVLLLGSSLVAYVSWLDDKHELSPRLRLIVHLLAVAIALFLLPPLFDFMPLWAEKVLLILGWGWFVNLYNFMDGADGLATTQAIVLSLGLALLVPAFAPLALVIAAVAVGFLRVNWQPARVFMGDVGSTWLGYVLGGLFLLASVDDTFTIVWPLATLTLLFSGDATTTLIRRVVQGHKPWEPHKTFWFHRFLALGNSHARLVLAALVVNGVLLAIALISINIGQPFAGFIVGLLALAAVACYIRAAEHRLKEKRHVKTRRQKSH